MMTTSVEQLPTVMRTDNRSQCEESGFPRGDQPDEDSLQGYLRGVMSEQVLVRKSSRGSIQPFSMSMDADREMESKP